MTDTTGTLSVVPDPVSAGVRETEPGSGNHVALGTVASTNAEARRLAGSVTVPTWVTAVEQTAGRGRLGRHWHSPAGNFHATLILPAVGGPESAVLRSFTAALAVREALSDLVGCGDRFRLKWPNDVMADGRKIAGILLETVETTLLVGIGVNLVAAPELHRGSAREAHGTTDRRAGRDHGDGMVPAGIGVAVSGMKRQCPQPVHLRAISGRTVSSSRFLAILASAFEVWENRLVTVGFRKVREEWLRHATGLGGVVTARMGACTITGVFETVDACGAIVLHSRDGRQVIAAADIHFPQVG